MDRISKLPDCVLSHILSILPTQLAASTCILSKRWQFLWISVHNLDLNFHEAFHQKDQVAHAVTSFVNFVSKFFSQRDKDLGMKSFRIKLISKFRSIPVDSWVLDAVSSCVEELDLDLDLIRSFRFLCSYFTCETLVVLKLSSEIVIDAPPSSIHFPSLKVLYLSSVRFETRHSFHNLVSGCPVLESLELIEINGFNDFCDYVISSSTLRKLVMNFFASSEPIRLWLDAPSLEHLRLDLYDCRGLYFKNLGSLVHAVINSSLPYEVHEFSDTVRDVIGALYNVQVLQLDFPMIKEVYDASFEDFPVFHNLIQSTLKSRSCILLKLPSLLQKFPYLQQLTLHLECCNKSYSVCFGGQDWAEPDVSNCLSRLRTLCIYRAFGCSAYLPGADLVFLAYVLRNSTVLEKVIITCCWIDSLVKWNVSLVTWLVLKKKILSFERVSEKCEIMFD